MEITISADPMPSVFRLPAPVRFASAAHRLYHFCRDILAAHGVRTHYEGWLPDGPAVLVAQHFVSLDPLAVIAGTPCVPIAPSGASWTILEPVMQTLRPASTDRRDYALQVLAAGTSILGFEADPAVRRPGAPFDRAVLLAARDAAVPVVPVAVCYPERTASVVFGPALDPATFPDAPSLGRAASTILACL